jgi:hypothetical protein
LEEVIETYETSPSDKLQSVLRDELYAKMEKKMKEKPMQQSGEDTDK